MDFLDIIFISCLTGLAGMVFFQMRRADRAEASLARVEAMIAVHEAPISESIARKAEEADRREREPELMKLAYQLEALKVYRASNWVEGNRPDEVRGIVAEAITAATPRIIEQTIDKLKGAR